MILMHDTVHACIQKCNGGVERQQKEEENDDEKRKE